MPTEDTTYKFFINNFKNENFEYSARIMFDILSAISKVEDTLSPSWEFKLQQLLKFLFNNKFTFETADDFYDMLATIASKIKKDSHSDWKTILN